MLATIIGAIVAYKVISFIVGLLLLVIVIGGVSSFLRGRM